MPLNGYITDREGGPGQSTVSSQVKSVTSTLASSSALSACNDADIAVVLTEWNKFRAIDLKELQRVMRGDVLVDLRNVFQPTDAKAAGLTNLDS